MIQISILGLGQIGSSICKALSEKPDLIHRIGYDIDPKIDAIAKKEGVVDRVAGSLPEAVEAADLVILSLPTDQIHTVLQQIAPHLKAGAVVMDTAPIKEKVVSWAKEILPPERYYVGLTPVINPQYLQVHERGQRAAHPDLFRGGMMLIVVPPDTPPDAVKLAADFTRLLGAVNLFADPVEVDSLMAATHILPQLMAAALLNITVDQPGWNERSKAAGKAFAEATNPIVLLGDPDALGSGALLAGENLARLIDRMIAVLQAFRSDIIKGDSESLIGRLERARQGREEWWQDRQDTENESLPIAPSAELPRPSDYFSQLLGGFARRGKGKEIDK